MNLLRAYREETARIEREAAEIAAVHRQIRLMPSEIELLDAYESANDLDLADIHEINAAAFELACERA